MSDTEPTEIVEQFKERLSGIGEIKCANFLGGWGFSVDGFQFAVSIKDRFYFQVDDSLREELIIEGSTPFSYSHRDRNITIHRFYAIPEEIMADDNRLKEFAIRALNSARSGDDNSSLNSNPNNDDAIKKILMVCTSHDKLGDTGNSTGFWFGELANAYKIFSDSNFSITFASPDGGQPPADPGSNSPEFKSPIVMDFESNASAMRSLSASIPLADITDTSKYDAIMLIGGHGTMWDFPNNQELGRIIDNMVREDKPIGAVCHGSAGLLSASEETIYELINGKQLTCFSNEEEASIGLTSIVPFLLEDRLKELGANYSSAKPLRSNICVDGKLVTGQNPPSAFGTAQSLVDIVLEDV